MCWTQLGNIWRRMLFVGNNLRVALVICLSRFSRLFGSLLPYNDQILLLAD